MYWTQDQIVWKFRTFCFWGGRQSVCVYPLRIETQATSIWKIRSVVWVVTRCSVPTLICWICWFAEAFCFAGCPSWNWSVLACVIVCIIIPRPSVYILFFKVSNVFEKVNIDVAVGVSVPCKRFLGNHHQTWHGDYLRHADASRVNYIDTDLLQGHTDNNHENNQCSIILETFKQCPSRMLWR